MDLAKSGLIRKILFKGRGAEISAMFARPPSDESPFQIPRHLVQQLAFRILIANAAMKIHRAFVNSGTRSVVWQAKQWLHFE
jgi:hypothetical protein